MCGYIDNTYETILDIFIQRAVLAWNKRCASDDKFVDEQATKL